MNPMLAGTIKDCDADIPDEAFPLCVTAKIDGIRALKTKGSLVSRSMKPIRNTLLRETLEKVLPDGADGELRCSESFRDTTSIVMSKSAPLPSGEHRVAYYWFDWIIDGLCYVDRVRRIESYMEENSELLARCGVQVRVMSPKIVRSRKELYELESSYVADGNEGVIVRRPDGEYKFGRSTVRELLMLKMKRFSDHEARVVGLIEQVRKDGRRGGAVGALEVEDLHSRVRFKIGSGMGSGDRERLWMDPSRIIGSIVKYKRMDHGGYAKPRHPVFLGMRHEDDL